MERYFGFSDTEKVVPLGAHDRWDGAAAVADSGKDSIVWVFTEEGLRDFMESAKAALEGGK